VAADDPDLTIDHSRGAAHASADLHRYMLNHGFFMSSRMLGIISTAMDTSDVDPFCETLLNGIRELKGGHQLR
jgi:hypothetical protein